MLGKHLKYSSAWFEPGVTDLDTAEAVAALRIREFVPLDLGDYLPLRSLLP